MLPSALVVIRGLRLSYNKPNNKHILCNKRFRLFLRVKRLKPTPLLAIKNLLFWCGGLSYFLDIQSNLYKTTTFGAIQKWSSWKGGRLIKNLYQLTTNQIWSLLAGFSFISNSECFIRNRSFGVLVPILKIKNVLLLILNVHILKRYNTIVVHILLCTFSQ